MNKKQAKQQIQGLINRYESLSEKEIKSYNEQQTKDRFIRPLFEVLGWNFEEDVWSEKGIQEKRVDYAFVLDGLTKFLVEAKSLRTDLDLEQHAKQAINYSWNKGVTWAILTDFEGLKVFNAQIESKELLGKLVFEINYKDYLSDFDRLWLLSKESFKTHSLDEYAVKYGKKIKKLTVNEKLFIDLKEVREEFIRVFPMCNKDKNIEQEIFDEGIQRILDRLVFIRVLEDRELEEPILKPLLRAWNKNQGEDFLLKLKNKFRDFDRIYNSSLFKYHPCENWVDYGVRWNKVINLLYGSHVYEYDFKDIPADILGGVYEGYLSYISQNPIKISKEFKNSKLLEFEDKKVSKQKSHKKRKEQGIYYTPKFVVDYIVNNTLGKKLEEAKSISDLKQIKVLDSACGSGSFLTKALKMINDKYISFGNPGNIHTKSEILLSNIYGVDLDPQAIELAKLNLLITALDKKAKLPDLTGNIRVGNSLLSYKGEELKNVSDKDWLDKKPFNWQEEFVEILKKGGFDVIIGNPPYIKEYTNREAFDGLHNSPYYQGKMDIWTLFACQAIDLLKEGGYLSFIAPNNWTTNAGASIFRDKILSEGKIIKFFDFGDFKVFKGAGIQTMIFVFKKIKQKKIYQISYAKVIDKNIEENLLDPFLRSDFKMTNDKIIKFKSNIDPRLKGKNITFNNQINDDILNKIKAKKNFELTNKEVAQGIVGDPDQAFIFSDKLKFNKIEKQILFNYYTSIDKYHAGEIRGLIAYLSKEITNIDHYPIIKNQLSHYISQLRNRREVKNGRIKYFHLHWPRDKKYFDKGPKIISAIRTSYPNCFYTEKDYYGSRAMNFIKTDRINLKFLTGLLNSCLSYFWLKNKGKQLGDLLQIDKGPLLNIPLLKPNKEEQDRIASFVDEIIKLYQYLCDSPANSDKWNLLKSKIEKVEKKIDQEIYRLYGLNRKEIEIIEDN